MIRLSAAIPDLHGMRVCAAAAVALAVLVSSAGATSASPRTAQNGMYAFTSELSSSEAYIADADGRNVRRLTTGPGLNRWPALSPDGSRIAYASKHYGVWDIFVMNLDGSNVREITDDTGFDGYPDWSPDGRRIAFSGMASAELHVFVVDLATGLQQDLTPGNAVAMHPRWSPDGRLIAYDGTRYNNSSGIDIYTVDPDGGAPKQLTAAPGWERQPAWSPDGARIAYTGYPNGHADIFVMNADGSHPRDVTLTANSEEYEPAWSASGIAFRSNRGGRDGIYLMQPTRPGAAKMITHSIVDGDPNWSRDGRRFVFDSGRDSTSSIALERPNYTYRTLTHGHWFDTNPAWSPAGAQIAFSRSRTVSHSDLYIANAQTGSARRLTRLPGLSWSPKWSPNGHQIAFVHFESFGAQIWLVNSNGKNPHPITSSGAWNDAPSWSPDGRRLVYTTRVHGVDELAILDLRTKRSHRVTSEPYHEGATAWSPDGTMIAYSSPANGSFDDIYVIRTDGTGKRKLTTSFADHEAPTWAPDGKALLYEQDDPFAGDGTIHTITLDGASDQAVTNYNWSTLTPSWQPAA